MAPFIKFAEEPKVVDNLHKNPHEAIKEYINYFNNERPSSILKNKAPIQFRIESGFS